jgi:hypothetical protein
MATSQPVPFTPNTNTGTNAPTINVTNAFRDDNTVQLQVAQAVRDSNSDRIIPQDNILSQYASYTYNVSIYIMSPDDYNNIVRTQRFKIPGAQLLMSSGGAPNTPDSGTGAPGGNTGVTGTSPQTQANATAGRNQFFPLDFYLNDIKITSLQPGKGTRSPHPNTTLNFKVIEPNGITFLDNLYAATQAYVGKKQNYGSQNFCMVIKFYGYDETGKMVLAQGLGTSTGGTAVIEKWIPFQFTGIKFRIANKLTEYECSAVCVPNNVATGQQRGVIPYNLETQAETLKGILSGSSSWKNPPTTSAPPKANAAPRPILTSGLIEALNLYQEELVGLLPDTITEPRFEIADEYDIVFTDPDIENASLLPPGGVGNALTPTVQPGNSNQQVNGAAQTSAAGSKTVSATAGTSIIQFLDQTIRNSKYIYDQQLKIVTIDGKEEKQKDDLGQGIDWFRIGVKAEPIKYDRLRRDYAYKITYIVSPYRVNEVKGPYFPSTKFKGTHKKYLYWYTGLNTEILSYEQDFNYLYYIVINSGQTLPSNDIDFREEAKRAGQTRSNESDQGLAGKTNDAGANAADQLYSPGDLARAKLSILGDPAWIHQNELWFGVTEGAGSQDTFFPDGSINTEIQEPLFEVGFNKPADYNLQSGRMEVNTTGNGANRYTNADGNGMASQSYIYRAVSVTSTLANGRFTQDLEGVLVTFPRTAIKVNDAAVDSQFIETEQDTQRLLSNIGIRLNNRSRGSRNSRTESTTTTPGQPSSPTTPSVSQNPSSPATNAPAAAPTSSGQPVGPANPVTPTNAQTGGTLVTENTQTRFDANIFRTKDPASFAKFEEYRNQQFNLIFQSEKSRLSALAVKNNPQLNDDPATLVRLVTGSARITAGLAADEAAIALFDPQIKAAGAGGITTTTTPTNATPVNTSAPQISSREP